MDELATLQTLRDDVTEPTRDQLAPAFGRLNRAMSAPSRRRAIRARWVLGGVAGAAALTLVTGNVAMAAETAQTASLLQTIAGETVTFTDPPTGQYMHARTHADWLIQTTNTDGSATNVMSEQTIDVYMPANGSTEWALHRTWEDGDTETLRAVDGIFYDTPWVPVDVHEIPTDSGEAALAFFDAQYTGGNTSRDEDNFDRITDVLATGLAPAKARAAMFAALALIPGVTSTANVANFDGEKGIAIGRTEALRGGERQEIIVDPDTGLVIGERDMFTVAAFGFGVNEVIGLTAVATSTTDTTP